MRKVEVGQIWTVRLYSWSNQKEEVEILEVCNGWARYARLDHIGDDGRYGRIQVDYLLDNPAWRLGRVELEPAVAPFRSF